MIRILKDITFNETEIATFINIRNLPQKAIILTTESTETTEITEIIEDIANANDTNTIFENIKNAPFKSIIVEPALIRRSIRHRKATFKTIEINAVKAAEAPTIPANEKESEEENYLPKAMIAKLITANENKSTYEKAMASSKKF
jgi:hypothetical protein